MIGYYIFVFVFGLLIGSFLNVVIYRVPREMSIVTPRSKCIKCGTLIKWYQNIPVISYLLIRGKCPNCGVKISIRYPIVELLCGFFALLLIPQNFSHGELLRFAFQYSVACVFLAHLFIDLEHHLLPDKINLYLLAIVIPYVVIEYPLMHWLLGGFIGFFITYSVTYAFYKFSGKIGLGGGDIKLFGILGMIFGPVGILQNIMMSCMLGSIIGIILIYSGKLERGKPFAFGPFIIIVASIQIFLPKVFEYLNILAI